MIIPLWEAAQRGPILVHKKRTVYIWGLGLLEKADGGLYGAAMHS